MTDIIKMLAFEEGWRERPYLCSERYPTVGYGFKIGPKGAPIAQYDFTLPREAGDVWLMVLARELHTAMRAEPAIARALTSCSVTGLPSLSNPRYAVLVSMAYQMGVAGLAGFRNTLLHIANCDWYQAETGMLKSRWATQSPARARRHARQMRTGLWAGEYGV